MKKCKQILAAVLAITLSVCAVPFEGAGLNVNAENLDEESINTNELEMYAEEDSETTVEDSNEIVTIDESAEDNIPNEDVTGEDEVNDAPETDAEDNADEGFFSDAAESADQESDATLSFEESGFSDGSQQDLEASEIQTNEIVVQSADSRDLPLSVFGSKYNEMTKTVNIDQAKQLILLSHCNPEQVQNIKINFIFTGDFDLTETITKGTSISALLGTANTVNSVESDADDSIINFAENEQVESSSEENDENFAAAVSSNDQSEEQNQELADDNNDNSESLLTETSDNNDLENQEISVQDEVVAADDYTYIGLGTETYPFKGEITGTNFPRSIKVNTSFFSALSSIAKVASEFPTVTWAGTGAVPMITDIYQFDVSSDGTICTLPIKVKGDSSAQMGPLVGTVRAASGVDGYTLTIVSDTVTYGTSVNVTSSDGNAGLICNTLENGTICLDGFTFPSLEYKVTASGIYKEYTAESPNTTGNAGGIIGAMYPNTKLEVKVSKISQATVSTKGNAGGMVGFLGNNATIQTKCAIEFIGVGVSGANSAGGLVGAMSTEASIETDNFITFTGVEANGDVKAKPTVSVESSSGSAGGLVGTMDTGAQIATGEGAAITISSENVDAALAPTIIGGTAAGGVIGTAKNVTFNSLKSGIVVDKPSVNGSKAGANAGGFIGNYTLNVEIVGKSCNFPDNIAVNNVTVWVSGTQLVGGGNAGGYFGILTLEGKISYSIGASDNNSPKVSFTSTYKDRSGNAQGYGGIAGQLYSDDIGSSLIIHNMKVNTTSSTDGNNRPGYNGGLVGRVGDTANEERKAAYLSVDNVDISVINPHAARQFGGVAAYLTQRSILKVHNVSVETKGSSDPSIWEGGGILGKARPGSVLELSGVTDLTNTYFQGNGAKAGTSKALGQLVRDNEAGLIYARGDGNGSGWTYKRCNFSNLPKTPQGASQYVNDIGTYGQVIRLKDDEGKSKSSLSKDLIIITDDHAVQLKSSQKSWADNDIELSSADDYALLAIAWNSRGCFSADKAINAENWKSLYSKNIKITADIDMTGTGITELTRDRSAEDAYTGTLSGNDKYTLTLAIGETFGYQNNEIAKEGTDGCGKVYAYGSNHNYQGIFAKMQGSVDNLKIDGSIHVSNAASDMKVGGIAAEVSTGTGITVTKVSATENITVDVPKTAQMAVGGLYGWFVSGGGDGLVLGSTIAKNQTEVPQDKHTDVAVNIEIKNSSNATDDTKIFAGSVIGLGNGGGFKLQCNDLTIGGSISSDAKKNAHVGGVIGVIEKGNGDHWMEIRNLVFEDFSIDAPYASESCGGLLGSIWSKVGVYFMISNDDEGTKTKLMVKKASINAPNAKNVGGLAYRSNGIWELRTKGVDMQKFTIKAGKDVGLLVCRGEKNTEKIDGGDKELDALYLNTTVYWGDETNSSYKIGAVEVNITNDGGAFDEFVAHTADTANSLISNGENGVISIATQQTSDSNTSRVGVNVDNCTTYQNRTTYGKTHQINGCSRYYYDLDQCLTEASKDSSRNNNGYVDTPQELLLWSAYHYACANIQNYLTRPEKNQNTKVQDVFKSLIIGNSSNSVEVALDMKKYSYYPINLDGNVDIENAVIIFYNREIERQETEAQNKSTIAASTKTRTQHYTMHSGLFMNHINDNKTASKVNVENVTFAGNIGKVKDDSGSGVLFAGTVSGYMYNQNVYTASINIKDVKFDNLTVNNCGNDYAPLLINTIGSYTTLSINGITNAEYSEGAAAASSLIGTVGASNGKQINLSFLNISLPDRPTNANDRPGIFSHATLLEAFVHDGSSSVATYNFYKKNDYKDEIVGSKYDHHNVTYGKEISHSVEYNGLQSHYYDKETYTLDTGLVKDGNSNSTDFSGYLPYVCSGYDEVKSAHEIKVNQRVADIIDGCGTYEHPYVITSAEQMIIISEYIASGGSARKDWKIAVPKNPSKYCTEKESQDVIYQFGFSGTSKWEAVSNNGGEDENWVTRNDADDIEPDVMFQYMLNAYYDIQGTPNTNEDYELTLSNFGGFGTDTNPFRGVLTTSKSTTVILKGAGTCNGLIPYSYGSVVKDLTIFYGKTDDVGKTLSYGGDTAKTSDYYPNVSFGGVFGSVLGGDNIIDNVTVNIAEGWLTLDGTKKHLITVGGYVGSVSGGGVIFRNMLNKAGEKAGLTGAELTSGSGSIDKNDYASLYVNPYVGRVLDGYVFNEVETETTLELTNTDKNYKINNIYKTDTGCVSTESGEAGLTATVNDSQGLLILSAIINSGAASGGKSNAYSSTVNSSNEPARYQFGGNYGKVRNASYKDVGRRNASNDATISRNDDKKAVGKENLPYLITKYCNTNTWNIADNSGVNIVLNTDEKKVIQTFDMTEYESGYQGISARYVSYAILQEVNASASNIVPELKSFDGQNNILKVGVQAREYVDDEFHIASLGGVFNYLRVGTSDGCTISNLVIEGKSGDKGVAITYYNSAGEPVDLSEENWNYAGFVDVGGFAGTTSSISTQNNSTANVIFAKVELQNMTITGPVNAGGLLGSTGRRLYDDNRDVNDIALLLQPAKDGIITVSLSVNDCKHTNIKVKAPNAVGGFVAYVDNVNKKTEIGTSLTVSAENPKTEITIGKDSTLGTENYGTKYTGGAFGYVKTKMYINYPTSETNKFGTAVMEDVIVNAKLYAGGFVARIGGEENGQGREYHINQTIFRGTSENKAKVSNNTKENTDATMCGGIVGYGKGRDSNEIKDSHLKNAQINEESNVFALLKDEWNVPTKQQQRTGGIIGYITDSKVMFEDCTVKESTIYGRITGGIAGGTESAVAFKNCEVTGSGSENKQEIKGLFTAGGIIGFAKTTASVSIQNSKACYLEISGKHWGVGGFIGDSDNAVNGGTIYLFDSMVKDVDITADGGLWYCAGGIIGNLRSNLTASNVLFSKLELTCTKGKGWLFGAISGSRKINIAGLSIQKISDTNKNVWLSGSAEDTAFLTQDNVYIAFADYSGKAISVTSASKDLLGSETNPETATEPYVVTSPKSSLHVSVKGKDETGADQSTKLYLYGDGASWTSSGSGEKKTFTLNAEDIFNNRSEVKNGCYPYKNIVTNSFVFNSKSISTYNANQSTQLKDEDDFPVLQLTAGDAVSVKDYLNILTNGGFSKANQMNKSGKDNIHVLAATSVYSYQNGEFTKNNDADPALQVTKDSNNRISFSTTSGYDNGKDQFTLLTVTFKEKDEDNKEHKYNVFVPIIVRRMLEIDFSATLSYGTNFRSKDYEGLTSHVLESFGSSITGYLTYKYNSEEGVFSDYGWQSYINAGGNVAVALEKSLWFDAGDNVKLPAGTQLSLVDQRDDKVYYYTVAKGRETDKIKLTDFTRLKDDGSGEENYQPPSLAELLSVKVDGDGPFIEVGSNGKPVNSKEENSDKTYTAPTVRLGDQYYRLAETGETGECALKVGSLANGTKSNVVESYFLVITIPDTVTIEKFSGSLKTTVESTSIPNRVHDRVLNGKEGSEGEDKHDNNQSTYLLSTGYKQELNEVNITQARKKITTSDTIMNVDVLDTITFPNGQAYLDTDELYLRFVGGLKRTINNNQTSAVSFPIETYGTAYFYVYKEEDNVRTYYKYNKATGKWTESQGAEDNVAVSYDWESSNGNMELSLSTDKTVDHAIGLQQVRGMVKPADAKEGNSVFYVELQMEVVLPETDLKVIPETTIGTDDTLSSYTKLTYSAQLSTVKKSLTYSNNRASVQDTKTTTQYYREETAMAELTYNANDVGQLGINLLDLDNMHGSKTHLIKTNASYDLSGMPNKILESVLEESSGIKFTLSLEPKRTTDNLEEYDGPMADAKNYMSVQVLSETVDTTCVNGVWSWTVPKDMYWSNNQINTASVFNGTKLTQEILLEVNIDNVETLNHYYSNYRVVLIAEILNSKNESVTGTADSDNIIYTLAKIAREFVLPTTSGSDTTTGN